MKYLNLYIILLSSLFLFSCGGSDDSGVQQTVSNEAPSVPKLVFPINNATCTNFNLEFDWDAASDSDGDSVSYTIEIAESDSFSTIVFTQNTSQTTNVFSLEKGTTYFWRVKSMDSEGNESAYSTIQSFFTEPEAGLNTIPTAPSVVSPTLGEHISGTNITLDWDASDTDGDDLSYDVYFGTSNTPSLVEQNITASQLEVTISPDTVYYWRVVVKDDQEGVTIGQVWNFRTE
ncbi:fibronectin type III domain-containing protein [Aquimarina sp. 2304DJ70-9]|uniref:fibronectin type III domain-containing protein n=1 Tax=Aquimarina penaris TaxID=3231044 RepID=UPI0034629E6D